MRIPKAKNFKTKINSLPLFQSNGNGRKNVLGPIKFGTFQGVFTPTLLTILGVIMYLRGPWVVGNAGVFGALIIITLATAITFFTALSLSSIVTNIRIRSGGAFSIISQSLGLEAGGAIGIPLYIAQALAVTMYIFGFREGWLYIFPGQDPFLVDIATFLLVFLVANISTDFAFKIQYVVLGIIALSLVSIGMSFLKQPINTEIQLFGEYRGSIENGFSGSNFWIVFAVFFPAVTGIMAGVNMSGDLEDPRKNIPIGTLAAVGLSFLIYIGLCIMVAYLASPKELTENYNVLIEKAYWAPIVLAGLLGATFSSALSSLVGAPRILQALGQNEILVYNKDLAKTDFRGEPKLAFYLTCLVVLLTLLMRDLNAIAPLLTMFFLIAYAMINVVVLIEQGLGQISFRPTLKVPIIIPLLGAAGCFLVMFIINATFGLIAIALVISMYIYLSRRLNLDQTEGDTRSGIFNSLAEWSAKVINKLPPANERAWQPNLLIPAQDVSEVVPSYRAIYNLARPKGSVKVIGFSSRGKAAKLKVRLPELCSYFMQQDISANYAVVDSQDYQKAFLNAMQSLKASFFTPNTIFLTLTDDMEGDDSTKTFITKAREYGFGAYLYAPYKKVGLGLEKSINLWLDLSEMDRNLQFRVEDINLGLLTAYLLKKNWNASLNILSVMNQERDPEVEKRSCRMFMKKLMTLARMPKDTNLHYVDSELEEAVLRMPHADLNILVIKDKMIDIHKIREHSSLFETSLLYTIDSGAENALA